MTFAHLISGKLLEVEKCQIYETLLVAFVEEHTTFIEGNRFLIGSFTLKSSKE